MMTIEAKCREQAHHELSGVRAALARDLQRYMTKSQENIAAGTSFRERASAFLTPELLTMLFHRISHYLYVNNFRRLASLTARWNQLLHKVQMAPQSCIGAGCRLAHPAATTFFGTAGEDLTIFSTATCCPHEMDFNASLAAGPRLGDRVVLGGQSVVLGPIAIPDDTKIAYSVALDRDATAGSLVVSSSMYLTLTPKAKTTAGN